MMGRSVPWVDRVRVSNYKSIAACDVTLGPLTVLLGPNGAGKSNFFDALAFVAEAVEATPSHAIDERGGLSEVLRRVPEPTDSLSITLDVTVRWGREPEQWARGEYGFEIARRQRTGQRSFEVVREACMLRWRDRTERFRVDRGMVDDPSLPHPLTIEPDLLYLPTAGARPSFAPLLGALRGMRFYHLDPAALRLPQPQAEGDALGSRGEHLGDVLDELAAEHPGINQRLDTYLAVVAPGVESVGQPDRMSDGTIRIAGVLAALFQPWVLDGRISLIGLENPEIALHPAAAGVLFDALTEASERVQVLVTSQSADLVDRDDLDLSIIRAVAIEEGLTVIGEVNAASLRPLRERRFTAGELLRAGQLGPEPPAAREKREVERVMRG